MLNRGAYWQCGFVIPKGSEAKVGREGLPSLHNSIASWRRLRPIVRRVAGLGFNQIAYRSG